MKVQCCRRWQMALLTSSARGAAMKGGSMSVRARAEGGVPDGWLEDNQEGNSRCDFERGRGGGEEE